MGLSSVCEPSLREVFGIHAISGLLRQNTHPLIAQCFEVATFAPAVIHPGLKKKPSPTKTTPKKISTKKRFSNGQHPNLHRAPSAPGLNALQEKRFQRRFFLAELRRGWSKNNPSCPRLQESANKRASWPTGNRVGCLRKGSLLCEG